MHKRLDDNYQANKYVCCFDYLACVLTCIPVPWLLQTPSNVEGTSAMINSHERGISYYMYFHYVLVT